jgi:carboxyl-terminal processing protease
MKEWHRSKRRFWHLAPWAILLVLLPLVPAQQQDEESRPRAKDRQISIIVTTLLQRQHLNKQKLDDEISRRTFATLLERLDPRRLYLLKEDVDTLRENELTIDDDLRKTDLSFLYKAYNRFAEKVTARLPIIDRWIDTDHDYSVVESYNVTDKNTPFATSEEELEERWRLRVKYDLLILQSTGASLDESRERLRRRYHQYAARTGNVSGDDELQLFLSSLATSFDPHTSYMAPSRLDSFRIRMELNYYGIGVEVSQQDGLTRIHKILPGGGAEKHGKLKANDVVISVGTEKDGPLVDVSDLNLSDISNMIRGQEGSPVWVGVLPAAGGPQQVYEIIRGKVELNESRVQGLVIPVAKKDDGSPLKFGVVDVPSFYRDSKAEQENDPDFTSTTRDIQSALEDFTRQGVELVIVDLRGNGGGSLEESVSATGLFIDEGPVVMVRDGRQRVTTMDDPERGLAWGGPLVVLTNRQSASASEIFAGAIQDYQRGLIVGDSSTHGKGTVQSLVDLAAFLYRGEPDMNLGALKLTIQAFYRPSGQSTQKNGVVPDLVLPSSTDSLTEGEAGLQFAMTFEDIESSSYDKLELVSPEWIKAIHEASLLRTAESESFNRWQSEREKKKLASRPIPLERQQFEKYRATNPDDPMGEDESQLLVAEQLLADDYFMEVLQVARQYYQLMISR